MTGHEFELGGSTRRSLVKTVGATAIASTAGCLGSLGGGSSSHKIGFTTQYQAGGWSTALVDATKFYAKDRENVDFNTFRTNENAQEQVTHINQMINQGYDAIVIFPLNSKTTKNAVEKAEDEGIPVFVLNVDIASPEVSMFVSWDDTVVSDVAGKRLIKEVKQQYPDKDQYRILDITAPLDQLLARLRDNNFSKNIEQAENFELAEKLNGKWNRRTAKVKTKQWINANGPPDGIYASMFAMGLGALDALKDLDLAYKRGHDEHIPIVQMDGSPQANKMISQGYMDVAYDQPNYFYGPIGIEYAIKYLENDGQGAIPDIGATVETDNLTIESAQHKGVELWKDPIWAPAHVKEKQGHPAFRTGYGTITQENAEDNIFWGNIWGGD